MDTKAYVQQYKNELLTKLSELVSYPSVMQIYADIPSSASHAQSLKVADAVRDAFTADNWKPGVYYYYYKEIKPEVYVIDLKDESDTADYSESTLRIMMARR